MTKIDRVDSNIKAEFADIERSINSLNDTVSGLAETNKKLETQLVEANKVIDFYGDKGNYGICCNNYIDVLLAKDDEKMGNGSGWIKGKRAREYQEKWGLNE